MPQELTNENLERFSEDIRELWDERFGENSETDGTEHLLNKGGAKLSVLVGEALWVAYGLSGGDLNAAIFAVGKTAATIAATNPEAFGNQTICTPEGHA